MLLLHMNGDSIMFIIKIRVNLSKAVSHKQWNMLTLYSFQIFDECSMINYLASKLLVLMIYRLRCYQRVYTYMKPILQKFQKFKS